jgi:hypothetical protein
MEFAPLGDDMIVEIVVRTRGNVHKMTHTISEQTIAASVLRPEVLLADCIFRLSNKMITRIFDRRDNAAEE